MAIDKVIKEKVIEDWQNTFPQLSMYAQDKLYKVVGSIVIGLELIKLPRTEEYRPHFVVYPLWKQNVKASIDIPIILKEYYNKKGLQYSIPYEKHSVFFGDVLDSVKKQSPLPFEGNISLKKVIAVLDEYSKTPPLSAAPNSYLQAVLQEAKLKIALSISSEEAQSVLEQINKRSWDANHFKACGVDVNEWLQILHTTITNRDEFLKQIETNKQDKKIAKLESSELTV
uniref:hypothetical protein n=1 Tax=Pedobacter schmidteae TaxID=2201271 RepID=UPI000EB244AE|nr:hypothetical protein [Pedobacter schmidteae]